MKILMLMRCWVVAVEVVVVEESLVNFSVSQTHRLTPFPHYSLHYSASHYSHSFSLSSSRSQSLYLLPSSLSSLLSSFVEVLNNFYLLQQKEEEIRNDENTMRCRLREE